MKLPRVFGAVLVDELGHVTIAIIRERLALNIFLKNGLQFLDFGFLAHDDLWRVWFSFHIMYTFSKKYINLS